MHNIRRLQMLFICAVIVTVIAPTVGTTDVNIFSIATDAASSDIFFKIRLPRVFLTFCAGAGLSLSGMVFQSIFRNPLATPFTLGVSSGATFGAAIAVKFSIVFSLFGISTISIFSFVGAMLTIFMVFTISKIIKNFHTYTMLLAGIAVSFFFSSLILFIQYIASFSHSHKIVHWIMGSVDVLGYTDFYTLIPFLVVGMAVIVYHYRELNILAVDAEFAVSRGVNIDSVIKKLFLATSLLVGGVVAITGPIGFVGMIVPHIIRIIFGTDHKYLIPAVILGGGMFLTICDTIARTLIFPAEIPVGVFTAMLGGPFFLWLLIRKSKVNV